MNRMRTLALAVLIAAFLVTNMDLFVVSAAAESVELFYDDGEMDSAMAFGGAGHAVRFTPPTKMWIIEGVKVYGNRYGEIDQKFYVEVWDEDRSTLCKVGPYDYSQYFTTEWTWTEIEIPSVIVKGDFYVCFFADTRPEYGISVGYDSDPPSTKRSYIALPDGEIKPADTHFNQERDDWMIRAIGRVHPPVKLTLKVDPTEVTHYTMIQGEGLHEAGSTVALEAETPVSGPSGTRYVFAAWQVDGVDVPGNPVTITMDAPHEVTAKYKVQYELTVVSDYVELKGSGWYDVGSTVSLEAEPLVDGPSGTRYVFVAWQIDGGGVEGNSVTVTMNAPHEATATYKVQYRLTVASDYGDPHGSGWYDSGSTATFSVTPSTGTLIQQIFVKWMGDLSATTPAATIVMGSPKSVRAVWRIDYTQLFAIAGAIGAVVIVIIAVALKKRT